MAEAQQKHELISRALNSDDKVICLSNDDLHHTHFMKYRNVQIMLLLTMKERRWIKMNNHCSHSHHQNDQQHEIQVGYSIQMRMMITILVRKKDQYDTGSHFVYITEIKMNPVLEGEKGRERLALQSTFKGDERFKLDEDFIDEEEIKKPRDKKDVEEDEITKDLNAEKDQSMDVLRAMFGEDTVNKT